ncbi:MAG: VCBS repeat-containing protein [Caldilineaceae bacterium]
MAWGDYDNDGDLDIVVSGLSYDVGLSGERTDLYRNNGDGSFTRLAVGLAGLSYSAVAWADYDRDGDLDLVVSGDELTVSAPIRTVLYRNEGAQDALAPDPASATPRFTAVDAGLPPMTDGDLAWGDYDGDGDPDLLLTGFINSTDSALYLYRNDASPTATGAGDGGAPLFVRVATLSPVSRGNVEWSDYDNDGDLDIVVAGNTNTGGRTAIYRNDGIVETLPQLQLVPFGIPGVSWGDVAGGF